MEVRNLQKAQLVQLLLLIFYHVKKEKSSYILESVSPANKDFTY